MEVIGVVGTQKEPRQTKTGKTEYRAEFVTPKGKFYVKRFNDPWQDLQGEQIKFKFSPAFYNEQFRTYTVKDIEVLDSADHIDISEPVQEEKPKRNYSSSKPAVKIDRESLRAEAVESTKKDFLSALEIIESLGLEEKSVNLVDLADRVGRTITAIQKEKAKG